MILVDTSVWVGHLKQGNPQLKELLQQAQVAIHPFVIGELQCGSIKNRTEILSLLSNLPQSEIADHQEVSEFIENRKLFGIGIGWIDMHLICSALLSKMPLWTFDTRLRTIAAKLKISYSPSLD